MYVVHLNCAGKKYLRGLQQHDGRLYTGGSGRLQTSSQTYINPLGDEDATSNNFSKKMFEEVGSIEILHSNCEKELILCKEEGDNDKQCHGCMQSYFK